MSWMGSQPQQVYFVNIIAESLQTLRQLGISVSYSMTAYLSVCKFTHLPNRSQLVFKESNWTITLKGWVREGKPPSPSRCYCMFRLFNHPKNTVYTCVRVPGYATDIWWITRVGSLRFSCSGCARTLRFNRSNKWSICFKFRLFASKFVHVVSYTHY